MQYTGKHTFSRHDAVAGNCTDGTYFVAFFSDLGDLQNYTLADPQPVPDDELIQIQPPRDDILREGALCKLGQFFLHPVDALGGQQRDLTVPLTGVCVAGYTPVCH